MDFSPDSTFDFGPRVHDPGVRFKQRRFVLWPAWAWRAVVPVESAKGLNPLQRTVLRLARAGTRRYEEIAALLGLHPELIACVGQELIGLEAVDATGRVTPRGEALLGDQLYELADMAVAWIFADGQSGQLFPHLAEGMAPATVEADERGHPVITMGSKGRPYTTSALVLRHTASRPAPPTPADVLDAIRRHRRRAQRFNQMADYDDVETPRAVRQIKLLDPAPLKAHLLTFVYVPGEPDGERLWYITDPFGLGASPTLAQEVETLQSKAKGRFRELLDTLVGAHLAEHKKRFVDAQLLIQEEAKREVAKAVPTYSELDDAELRGALTQAFASAQQARLLDRIAPAALEGAYLYLRQAIEAGLALTLTRHPLESLYEHIQNVDSKLLRATMKAAAIKVGFPAEHIPPAFLAARPETIKFLCTHKPRGQLRPVVSTLLLSAAGQPQHPMRRVAVAAPTWLVDLNALVGRAGQAVHAGRTKADIDQLEGDLEVGFELINTLLRALIS